MRVKSCLCESIGYHTSSALVASVLRPFILVCEIWPAGSNMGEVLGTWHRHLNDSRATILVPAPVAFCAVPSGKPRWPARMKMSPCVSPKLSRAMGLRYAVVTSVNRDDQARRRRPHLCPPPFRKFATASPAARSKFFIPPFSRATGTPSTPVLAMKPDILNHNTETVPRLYARCAKGALYERSLELLRRRETKRIPTCLTKTGMMLGLGAGEGRSPGDDARISRHQGTDILHPGVSNLQPRGEHSPR